MSTTVFIICLSVMLPALIAMLRQFIGIIIDEFQEGHRSVGFSMIGLLLAIMVTAQPWYRL